MRSARLLSVPLLLLLAGAAPAPRTLVVCAPGSPGDTAEAQPTMDAFARVLERAARLQAGSLEAIYYSSEADGERRLRGSDAALALVTAPFFHKYGADLGLEPRLRLVAESEPNEVWSLVAKKGSVRAPASLDGWEVSGVPGFAPEFVRGPVLGGWGVLPSTVRISFTARVSSALLKAAGGERIAVLLDAQQTRALASHPNAADLEVVASSRPLPSNLVCTVRGRGGKDVTALLRGFTHWPSSEDARALLQVMHVTRFEPVDAASLEAALGNAPARP